MRIHLSDRLEWKREEKQISYQYRSENGNSELTMGYVLRMVGDRNTLTAQYMYKP